MIPFSFVKPRALLLLVLPLLGSLSQAEEVLRLDEGWLFHKGDLPGPVQSMPEKAEWRSVRLPHDWGIENPPARENVGGGDQGYFETGLGWYLHALKAAPNWKGKHLVLRLDGASSHARVWLDGTLLAEHPYAYTPTDIVLDELLKTPDKSSLLAVRLDNSEQPNSRWYSGSGLYRHATLHVFEPVHLAMDGLRISTEAIDEHGAELIVDAELENSFGYKGPASLNLEILDPQGTSLIQLHQELTLDGSAHVSRSLKCKLKAALWSPSSPALHTLKVSLSTPQQGTDLTSTRFGVRTLAWNAREGLLLNGKSIKLFGANVHHDNGPLGAASFDEAEERKVRLLLEAGFNAVRCSHNPPAPAFLEACDRLGMLVMDEAFDGWAKHKVAKDYGTHFRDWWERDLNAMLRRDYNHPSIILYSLGNELFERGNADGFDIARRLSGAIRYLDRTRPITAGINDVPNHWRAVDGLFSCLDIAGYNYEMRRHADDHELFPQRIMLSTESYLGDHYDSWHITSTTPYFVGDFVWSGLDYLGEAGIGRVFPPDEEVVAHWKAPMWPWHGAACGDIDLTGWRKPISHARNIIWDRGEKLYASIRVPTADGRPWKPSLWACYPSLPCWTWPGLEGRELELEIFSRHEAIRVTLNGRLVSEQSLGEGKKFQTIIKIPYEPGQLRIEALDKGLVTETQLLQSAGPAKQLRLRLEQGRKPAGPDNLVFVSAEIVDAAGQRLFDAAPLLRWEVEGGLRYLGSANNDYQTPEGYQANPRHAHEGRALAVFQGTGASGPARIHVIAEGLPESILELRD